MPPYFGDIFLQFGARIQQYLTDKRQIISTARFGSLKTRVVTLPDLARRPSRIPVRCLSRNPEAQSQSQYQLALPERMQSPMGDWPSNSLGCPDESYPQSSGFLKWNVTTLIRWGVIFSSLQHFIAPALDLMPCLPSNLLAFPTKDGVF